MEVAYLSSNPVADIPESHDTLLSPPKLCSVLASIVLENNTAVSANYVVQS
jgi:hypothetical protein